GQRRRRGRGQRAVGAGHRHRRLDPPARRPVRHRRPQAHLRGGEPLRDDRLRLEPRPGRPADPRRHRRRTPLAPYGRPRRPRREAEDLLTMYTKTRHDGFGAEVKRRVLIGTYALSSGYYDAYYGRAQRVRTLIAEDFKAAFQRVDFVVTPTSPGVAFELGAKTGDPLAMYLNDYFTVPMPLAG